MCMETKRFQITKAILKKNRAEKSGAITLDYYKAILIATIRYQNKNRNIGQWNMIESPEINSSTYD